MQTVQHAGEQVGGNVRAHNDGGRTDAQVEEEGKSDVWGLWKGDGGGVTRFPPYDSARKGKGEEMGMDGSGHGRGGAANVSDGVPQGGDNGMPSRRVPGEGGDEDGDARALLEEARASPSSSPPSLGTLRLGIPLSPP